jgi:hypothetical protein
MNYIDKFQPGGTVRLKRSDGSEYGTGTYYPDLRNFYENSKYIINLLKTKIQRYNEIKNQMEKLNPEYTPTTTDASSWSLRDYIKSRINS